MYKMEALAEWALFGGFRENLSMPLAELSLAAGSWHSLVCRCVAQIPGVFVILFLLLL